MGVVLAGVLLGSVLVVGSGVSAQSVADVEVRDRLIADQENLLNTYRCLFGVDLGAVPGGCPNPDVVSPAAAPQNPTQHDLDVRDGLIQRQEALLNVYRCRFDVDTEIVPGGCPETGVSQPTPEVESDPEGNSGASDSRLYEDVHPTDYDNIEMRPSGQPYDSVNRLRGLGVFEGTDCGENRFCPFSPVDGTTFAVWLARALGESVEDAGEASDRLVELGIAAPCSGHPAGLCPAREVSREEMATFVSRALNLPESETIGFWDVGEGNEHFDSINRLVHSEIDDGCSELRFVPFDFCPNQLVARGELAELLVEVIDYIEAAEIIKIDPNAYPDNSIGLAVDYEERTQTTKVSWRNPVGKPSDVDHYVLQWRAPWSDFNYRRYQVVEFDSQKSKYQIEFDYSFTSSDLYAVRVITVYANGDRSVTNAVKVPSQDRQLRDLIKERVIDVYGDDQPWLVDTWRHMNSPASYLSAGRRDSVSRTGVGGERPVEGRYPAGRLKQQFVKSVLISEDSFRLISDYSRSEPDVTAIIHELGHAYTLTGGITENETPLAIGYLYIGLLVRDHLDNGNNPGRCIADELYANLAQAAFYNYNPVILEGFGSYWTDCGFRFDHQTQAKVIEDLKDIARKVFVDQETPQWFYDTYQLTNGSVDLDKLWVDISSLGSATGFPMAIISYGLRNSFGGYCSREDVRQFTTGERSSLKTPWVDAGNCQSGVG